MGTACPECGNMTEVDFGMAQCGACSSVFYVDLDGSISRSEEQESSSDSSSSPALEDWSASAADPANPMAQFVDASSVPEASITTEDSSLMEMQTEESASGDWGVPDQNVEEASWSYEEAQGEPSWDSSEEEISFEENEEQVPTPIQEETFEEPEESFSPQEESVSEVNDLEYEDSDDSVLEPIPSKKIDSKESFLAEVIDFANSDESAARDGILQYRLLIEGIDTSEEKSILREVLSDRKLLLSVEDLMAEVHEGNLEITGLNPIKASVIVAGLFNTKLKIKWSQSAINE